VQIYYSRVLLKRCRFIAVRFYSRGVDFIAEGFYSTGADILQPGYTPQV
jgi:hypothetical protein